MRSPKRKLRRALEDYQFDRTDVEAGRPVELTVTNCPFGLTIKFTAHTCAAFRTRPSIFNLQFLGDCSERDPPVPIPNTVVKPLSPDGTARASVWESRKSPGSP